MIDPKIFTAATEYARARCNGRKAFASAAELEEELGGKTPASQFHHKKGIKWSRVARRMMQTADADIKPYLKSIEQTLQMYPALDDRLAVLREAGLWKRDE